ncbi:hypothetical protein LTR85_005184 [Meristemomyces frigidus]|nr:hypothetical protein LTR85_005184 [Meristemomyces frigidus]
MSRQLRWSTAPTNNPHLAVTYGAVESVIALEQADDEGFDGDELDTTDLESKLHPHAAVETHGLQPSSPTNAPPPQYLKRKASSLELARPKRAKSSHSTGDASPTSLTSSTQERYQIRRADSSDQQDAEYVVSQLRLKPYILVDVSGNGVWRAGIMSYPCIMYLRVREVLPPALVQRYDAYLDTLTHALFYEVMANNGEAITIEHDEAIAALKELLEVPNIIKYIIKNRKPGSGRLLNAYIRFEVHMSKIGYARDSHTTAFNEGSDRCIAVGEDVGDGLRSLRPHGEDAPVFLGVKEYAEWDFVQCRYVDRTHTTPLNYHIDDRNSSVVTNAEQVPDPVSLDSEYLDIVLHDVLEDFRDDEKMTIIVGDHLFIAPRIYDICMGYLGIRGSMAPDDVKISNNDLVIFTKSLLLGLAQTEDPNSVTITDRKATKALLDLASLPWLHEERCMAGRECSSANSRALWAEVREATAKPPQLLTRESVRAAIPAEGIREEDLRRRLRVSDSMHRTLYDLLHSVTSREPGVGDRRFFLEQPGVDIYSRAPIDATGGLTVLHNAESMLANLVDWTAIDMAKNPKAGDSPCRRHYGVLHDMAVHVHKIAMRTLDLSWDGITIRLLNRQHVLEKRCYEAEDVIVRLTQLLNNYDEVLEEYSELPDVIVNAVPVNAQLGSFIHMLEALTDSERNLVDEQATWDERVMYLDERRVVIDEVKGSRMAWEAAALMKTGGLAVKASTAIARVSFWRCFAGDEV